MGLYSGPIRVHAESLGVSNCRSSEHARLLYAKPGHLSNRPELGSLSRFYLVHQACLVHSGKSARVRRHSRPGLADLAP
jgi:hypothetical protein